jgi:hypothetical protein
VKQTAMCSDAVILEANKLSNRDGLRYDTLKQMAEVLSKGSNDHK